MTNRWEIEMNTNRYQIVIADNFHYMDPDEYLHLPGDMTLDEAIEMAKRIVDEWLDDAVRQGTPIKDLYQQYTMFGDDPFIVGPDVTGKPLFSAWTYAREKCDRLLAAAGHRTGPKTVTEKKERHGAK